MQLNYKKFGEGEPLVILHGLFGSLDNWQTIARNMVTIAQQNFGYAMSIYIVDQRNHGRSPHSQEFNYDLLAYDLNQFIEQHQLEKVTLLGHSMGGKAAMRFAQVHPEKIKKLIVVDITPAAYDDRHSDVFEAIAYAITPKTETRKQIELRLREKLHDDEATIQFLLKNVERSDNGFVWKFNAQSLKENYRQISDEVPLHQSVQCPILFVKGERSLYINSSNYSSILGMFPNHELVEIANSGHWVHAEQPTEFTLAVLRFLAGSH